MASIAIPTRSPSVSRLGGLAGITNVTRLHRLTRLTRMTSLPILVKVVNGKMVKPVGRRRNGKMLKPAGPKIDTDGKMAKPLALEW